VTQQATTEEGPPEPGSSAETLTHRECMDLLKTAQVGRLAVVVGHYPEVFPVNYRLDDSVVVFGTQVGTKLAAAHHHNVGFEVDWLDPHTRTGWSVLVLGMAEDVEGHRVDTLMRRTQAVGASPWVGGDHLHLVRIIPASVTGRWLRARDLGGSTDSRGYL
jgi:nitroimidazol reductase NimA-like FMN-containing flavoprotein (pyridoxamine 5'-phosphate oxidase superfamily)